MGKLSNRIQDARRKTCAKCKKAKRADEFYANVRYADRRDSYCKACRAASAAKWRKDNPGGWAERMRRHRARKAGKALCPLCETYSLKAAELAHDMEQGAIDALDTLLVELGRKRPEEAGAKWCRACGREHVGADCKAVARAYLTRVVRDLVGHRPCAVRGCEQPQCQEVVE